MSQKNRSEWSDNDEIKKLEKTIEEMKAEIEKSEKIHQDFVYTADKEKHKYKIERDFYKQRNDKLTQEKLEFEQKIEELQNKIEHYQRHIRQMQITFHKQFTAMNAAAVAAGATNVGSATTKQHQQQHLAQQQQQQQVSMNLHTVVKKQELANGDGIIVTTVKDPSLHSRRHTAKSSVHNDKSRNSTSNTTATSNTLIPVHTSHGQQLHAKHGMAYPGLCVFVFVFVLCLCVGVCVLCFPTFFFERFLTFFV